MDDAPSPLPQLEISKPVTNVQVQGAFWQLMPATDTTFLSRIYFKNYPVPLFVGVQPPYPVPLPIIKLTVPQQRAFILKRFNFKVFQATGVGGGDMVEVAPSRVASYFGFDVKVGNQGLTDFNTNISVRGQVIDWSGGGNPTKIVSPAAPGLGTMVPFSGDVQPIGENFAKYAVAGQVIEATVWVMREPEFTPKMVSVQIEGYDMTQTVLSKILTRLSPARP